MEFKVSLNVCYAMQCVRVCVYLCLVLLTTKLMRFIYLLLKERVCVCVCVQTYNYYITNFSIKDIKLLLPGMEVCMNSEYVQTFDTLFLALSKETATTDGIWVDSKCGIFTWRKFEEMKATAALRTKEEKWYVHVKHIWRLGYETVLIPLSII